MKVKVCRDNNRLKAPDCCWYRIYRMASNPGLMEERGIWDQDCARLMLLTPNEWDGPELAPGEGPVLMQLSAKRLEPQAGEDET